MRLSVFAACVCAVIAPFVQAATPIATYEFNNTFAPLESGKPTLTPTDPGGLSVFTTDTVLGVPRTVWAFNGTSANTAQSGLTLATNGVIPPQGYSVDMVFEFTQQANAWRRIIDVENRQSDNGFYVNPSNNLEVFPVSGSTAAWTNNVYHHIVLTDTGATVKGYLDGVSEFSATTTLLNINNANNPGLLMNFFLDNVAAGGQQEWSAGRVSLIRVWDGVLTDQEAGTLATNPFVPEPSALATLCVASALVLRRRSSRRTAPTV
jgi:hypothetical protein